MGDQELSMNLFKGQQYFPMDPYSTMHVIDENINRASSKQGIRSSKYQTSNSKHLKANFNTI